MLYFYDSPSFLSSFSFVILNPSYLYIELCVVLSMIKITYHRLFCSKHITYFFSGSHDCLCEEHFILLLLPVRIPRPRELAHSNAFPVATETLSLYRLPITMRLLQLYCNMIIGQHFKVFIKLLDFFHHYLASKLLEFIKFISFYCYSLFLE